MVLGTAVGRPLVTTQPCAFAYELYLNQIDITLPWNMDSAHIDYLWSQKLDSEAADSMKTCL